MAAEIKCARQLISPIYDVLQKAWEESAPDQEILKVSVKGHAVSIEKRLVGEKKLPGGGPSHFCCDIELRNVFSRIVDGEKSFSHEESNDNDRSLSIPAFKLDGLK